MKHLSDRMILRGLALDPESLYGLDNHLGIGAAHADILLNDRKQQVRESCLLNLTALKLIKELNSLKIFLGILLYPEFRPENLRSIQLDDTVLEELSEINESISNFSPMLSNRFFSVHGYQGDLTKLAAAIRLAIKRIENCHRALDRLDLELPHELEAYIQELYQRIEIYMSFNFEQRWKLIYGAAPDTKGFTKIAYCLQALQRTLYTCPFLMSDSKDGVYGWHALIMSVMNDNLGKSYPLKDILANTPDNPDIVQICINLDRAFKSLERKHLLH